MTIRRLVTVSSSKTHCMRLTNAVAGAFLDLKTVGEGLALAEVDEVGLVTGNISRELVDEHACQRT
jgi:hypothetical protein